MPDLHRFAALILLCLAASAAPAAEGDAPAELPDWLADRTRTLSKEQLDFLRSEDAEEFTGTREMDGSAIIEYFDPLMVYLKEENAGQTCGW